MIGRILVSLTASAIAGFLLLVLIGLWDGYEREAKALGFSGIYERYLASQAGFAEDPKAYRVAVEAKHARTAVVGETAAIEESCPATACASLWFSHVIDDHINLHFLCRCLFVRGSKLPVLARETASTLSTAPLMMTSTKKT